MAGTYALSPAGDARLTNDQIKELHGTSRFPDLDPLTLNRVRYDDRLKEDARRRAALRFKGSGCPRDPVAQPARSRPEWATAATAAVTVARAISVPALSAPFEAVHTTA